MTRALGRWRRRRRPSAAWRLALVTAGTYAATTAMLGATVLWATHALVARQLDATIRESADALVAEYRTEGEAGLRRAIGNREARRADPLGYALFDTRGRRLAGTTVTPRPPAGWSNPVFLDPFEGFDPGRGLALDLTPDRRLLVVADTNPLERVDAAIVTSFAAALALVLALGTLGALLLGTFLRRRLAPIADTADAIIAGALDRRVPLTGTGDEFDRVAGSLNLMLARVAGLVANLRQVSGDLAHDLRTPLTRMRADLELAAGDDVATPVRQQAIGQALAQADEVLAIFEAILRIAEIEAGAARRHFTHLDLGELAREIAEAHAPAAEESGHRLRVSVAAGQRVEGDRQLLAQALVNLLGNALRHTPSGTRVRLEVTAAEPGAGPCLTVADSGPGVPAAERERIFARFVRLEAARATPGHGLGLSLVKAICGLHGIHLQVDDGAPGLVVRLFFPGP